MLNDNNLRASVEDSGHPDAFIDEDIEFLQGKAEGRWLDTGRRRIVGRVVMHGDAARVRLRVRCVYYLVLISLYVAHLQFVGDAFADGEASCENMSGRGKG